jgi:hypothetical protein
LAAAGIAWDISGAIALSRGFFFVSDDKLRRQAGSYWGSNPPAMRAFCEQRLDTRFGLGQLLVGFALQGVAALGFSISGLAAGVIAGGALFAWWVYLYNFPYWVTRDTLALGVDESSLERVWRIHFPDVSEDLWQRVLWNEGISFAKEKSKPR